MKHRLKAKLYLAWIWFIDGPDTLTYHIVKKKIGYYERLNRELAKKAKGKSHNQHLINACLNVVNSKPRVKIKAGIIRSEDTQ